jgi:hypothetical protein
MMTFGLLLLAGGAVTAGIRVVIRRAAAHDPSHTHAEFAHWSRGDAEVISALRVRSRIFLRIRFIVGTSIIQSDVEFPLTEEVPHAGWRIPIRYDPTAPARVTLEPGAEIPEQSTAHP